VRVVEKSVCAEPVEAPLSAKRPSTSSGLTEYPNTVRFAGYAAIFNRVDKGGDIIRPGAFGEFPEGQSLPLLWQHDPRHQIGRVDHVREDRRGLRVIGTLSTATRAGREAAAMLSRAAVKGLSFGYRVKRAAGEKPRELLDLDVAEISLVTFPMQTYAKVHIISGA
jgi:HK97 family phage prohead protease